MSIIDIYGSVEYLLFVLLALHCILLRRTKNTGEQNMKKLILMLLLAFSTIITVHAQSKKNLNELNRPDEEVDTSYYPQVGQGAILLQEFKEHQKELDEYHKELLKRIREKEIEEDDSLEDEFFRVFKEFKKTLDIINIPTQNLDNKDNNDILFLND